MFAQMNSRRAEESITVFVNYMPLFTFKKCCRVFKHAMSNLKKKKKKKKIEKKERHLFLK